MLSDFRLALRNLTKARGFAVIAIVTLGIGIGGATAMFSALRALVVDPFGYPESDRLVQVWSGDYWPLSSLDFLDLKEKSTSFSEFGVYTPGTANVGSEKPQAVSRVLCTSGALRAFGVRPAMGRWIEPADEEEGAPPVAVISDSLWQRTFGGEPELVGRDVRIDGENVTVIGIMPADFEFAGPWIRTEAIDLWLPLSLVGNTNGPSGRDSHWLSGIARLNDNVSVGSADAEIKAIGVQLSAEYPDSNTNKKFLVRSLHFELTRDIGSQVWMLFGAVSLVLLVACANVASMLLARNAQRQGELSVRVALGATRHHIVRLALAESGTLAAGGALAGMAFAFVGIRLLQLIAPASEARKEAIAIDGTVLLFALGAMVVAALLVGLPPAIAATRTSVSTVIRGGGRGAVGSKTRHHLLRGLIIGQVAVAFLMANGAALFSSSYLKLLEANESLSSEYILSAQINLHGERYEKNEDRVLFWEQLVERLETMPGVSAMGLTSKLPLEGGSNTNALVNDELYDPAQQRISVERSSVTAGYFDAMGLSLIKGRNLEPGDAPREERGLSGVIVNQAMVEKAWPDQEPLGQLMRGNNPGDPWYTAQVVGVVEDVRQWGADADVQPEMYTVPKGHWGDRVYVIMRSPRPANQLAPALRREVAAIDSELAVDRIRTLDQVVSESTGEQRAVAGMVNAFMVVALGLVAIGLYGTLSYHVLQRTREIGVRMALGALKRDILRLVFAQGSRWVLIGVLIGIGGTIALSSVLQSIVYRMERFEIMPLLLATTAVGVAALIACWLPARRAARMSPVRALRAD